LGPQHCCSMCTGEQSNTRTASFVQPLLFSSIVTALSLSTPPFCSNSSVPITQNLLQVQLHAVLLKGSLQLVTEVRHIGFCNCTGLYLLPFPPTNEVCNTKKKYLTTAVTCLKIQGVTQKFPDLWFGALARYNAAVCCYIVLQ